MMQKAIIRNHGIWSEEPGVWTGWHGLASDDVFVPMRFSRKEAGQAARELMKNRPNAKVFVKLRPPRELPWNEDEWRKATSK